jgi:hypothetical protein
MPTHLDRHYFKGWLKYLATTLWMPTVRWIDGPWAARFLVLLLKWRNWPMSYGQSSKTWPEQILRCVLTFCFTNLSFFSFRHFEFLCRLFATTEALGLIPHCRNHCRSGRSLGGQLARLSAADLGCGHPPRNHRSTPLGTESPIDACRRGRSAQVANEQRRTRAARARGDWQHRSRYNDCCIRQSVDGLDRVNLRTGSTLSSVVPCNCQELEYDRMHMFAHKSTAPKLIIISLCFH